VLRWWPPLRLPARPMSLARDGESKGSAGRQADRQLFHARQPAGAWVRDRLRRAGVCWPWWPRRRFRRRLLGRLTRGLEQVRFDGMLLSPR